jgi:hypothetical protein
MKFLKKNNTEKILLIVLMIINVTFLLHAFQFTEVIGYGKLPQPFSVYKNDTFMDYYNVNYHALQDNFYYGEFKSVYSPVFRFFSKLFTNDSCIHVNSALDLKYCDKSIVFFYIIFYLINILLLNKIMQNYENKILFLLLVSMSFPLIFTLERGNYILMAAILLNFIVLTSEYKYINYSILFLPFIKFYFLFIFIIYLINGLNHFIYKSITFSVLMLILFNVYNDNILNMLNNLAGFNEKRVNIFDLLNATSLKLLIKYIDLQLISFFYIIIKIYLMIRLYIYISININNNKISLDEYKFVLFILIVFLIINLSGIGYYSLILLYPFALYFISINKLNNKEKYIVLLTTIPYPIEIVKFKQVENALTYINVQSVIIPLLLIALFISLTSSKRFDNEN